MSTKNGSGPCRQKEGPLSAPLKGPFRDKKRPMILVVRTAAVAAAHVAVAAVMAVVPAMEAAAHHRVVPVAVVMVDRMHPDPQHDVRAKGCGAEDEKPQCR
jgi:hypothetical protein